MVAIVLRALQMITAADIIEAIEGPIALTACVEGADAPCSRHAMAVSCQGIGMR